MSTIFSKIIAGEIPCKKVKETDRVLAFHDISPQAPVHVLVIPKEEIADANAVTEEQADLIGELFVVAKEVAAELGVGESGYRLVVNCGPDALMAVPHLHIHVIGGRKMEWPPG